MPITGLIAPPAFLWAGMLLERGETDRGLTLLAAAVVVMIAAAIECNLRERE